MSGGTSARTGTDSSVKAISVLPYATPSSPSHPARRLVLLSSVSSDGFIRLFDLTALAASAESGGSTEAEAVASYDTKGSRLTVCYLADGRKISGLSASTMGPQVGSMEEVDDVDESESEEEDGEDMYDIGSDDEDEDGEDEGGMEVEIEDEDEGEFEDEGEYESG
jgi:protein MAK11